MLPNSSGTGARSPRPGHASLTRRRLLAAAPAAMLATAAAACGTSGSSGRTAKSPKGKVTLTYGLWDLTQLPAMKQIIAEFEKAHRNITIRTAVTPWDSYWTKLKTAATGGSAPDVFWMTIDSFKLYASGGVLLPLDDSIKRDGVDIGQYVPAVTNGYQWKGQQFGIPKDTNSFGLFYNKELFAKASVAPPSPNWTWDDLVAAAVKLTDKGTGVHGIAAPLVDVQGYYLTIPQAGGFVISPDGRSSGYDKPGTIKGLEFWTDLINKHHASPTLQQLTDTDALSMFTSGKVAMYYGGSWDPVAIAAVPYTKKNADVAPLPKGPKDATFYANGLANVVYAKTKYPEESWEFVKFLGSKAAARIQAGTGTVIPAYRGEESAYAEAIPQFNLRAFVDQLPNARTFPSSVQTSVWSDNALKVFAASWSGQEPVARTAGDVAAQMNSALAAEPS
ncbi:ABC transporter substrate-binding protein [Actinopolymorpha pittospori]